MWDIPDNSKIRLQTDQTQNIHQNFIKTCLKAPATKNFLSRKTRFKFIGLPHSSTVSDIIKNIERVKRNILTAGLIFTITEEY
jgi:hypothetical protein